MRRLLALTLLTALVPTWLSASGCMVCPHMLGHDGATGHGAGHAAAPNAAGDDARDGTRQATRSVSRGASHTDDGLRASHQPEHAPRSPTDNCPCDSFCSVAPVTLQAGGDEYAPADELSQPVLHRPEPDALLTPERPPFFLPLSNAPPALD